MMVVGIELPTNPIRMAFLGPKQFEIFERVRIRISHSDSDSRSHSKIVASVGRIAKRALNAAYVKMIPYDSIRFDSI